MNSLILADALVAPHLFQWNGAIDAELLVMWVQRHHWFIPTDLLEFWQLTGGGQVFETETFLSPVTDNPEDSAEAVSRWHRQQGMLASLLIFHEGLQLSAVNTTGESDPYVSLELDRTVSHRYPSLDDWYTQVLRAEYSARYGLPSR